MGTGVAPNLGFGGEVTRSVSQLRAKINPSDVLIRAMELLALMLRMVACVLCA